VVAVTVVVLAFADGTSLPAAAAAAAVVAALVGCAALARRRAPAATVMACGLLLAAGWLTGPAASVGDAMLLIPVLVLVYRLASGERLARSLPGTVLLIGCWQAGALWHGGAAALNPSYFYVAIGAFAVGVIVRARAQARDRLHAQAGELAAAQQRYTEESVRAERVRIARELHDIVAHCVSAIVVQANAGQKLAIRDPALAAATFEHITTSAGQATVEISRLVALLDPEETPPRRSIDDLVARAQATGLPIQYRPGEPAGGTGVVIDEPVDAAAYAIVQEALTNALKHAPGAAIEIIVRTGQHRLTVSVCNGPARAGGLPLAGAGGQHGLTGLRERVTAVGGSFTAEPTDSGGWLVQATLPASPADTQ
jgi:signal transduction histidine kinase